MVCLIGCQRQATEEETLVRVGGGPSEAAVGRGTILRDATGKQSEKFWVLSKSIGFPMAQLTLVFSSSSMISLNPSG
jgi:hypothetical protein